jgi:Holliday junction resolvasome RuvABC ATP-dependent DNA helicase subunit
LPTACIKFSQVNPDQHSDIKNIIRKKIAAKSNNQFLETFLEAPNSVKEIFRLSRILFKELQHLILIGPPGCGKLEYLQLAAILNDALIFELNCTKFCDSITFLESFKATVISCVSLNLPTYMLINELQLRDPIYIDFVHHFLGNMSNKHESTLLYSILDPRFKQALITIEKDLYAKATIKRSAEPTEE